MNKATLKKFKTLLTDKRDEILKKAKQTLEQDMALDTDDLPDEMDLASSEYLQSFTFRLRGREKSFLDKIEKALKKIDEGTFGVCEECGEEISVKRLEARPETDALHPLQGRPGADREGLLLKVASAADMSHRLVTYDRGIERQPTGHPRRSSARDVPLRCGVRRLRRELRAGEGSDLPSS